MTPGSQPSHRNLRTIDMIGVRKDGGVDLAIIIAEKMKGSREEQQMLMDRVEAYLKVINSERFRKDYNDPPPHKTGIVIKCLAEPGAVIVELVHKMDRWVRDNRARIRLETEEIKEEP